ncbi:hypothetical protein TNCV_2515721 [Trichonephila clavipes]|nr:hypothetical protein TNCV_2515721 [Trichonephila clavipes]
MFRQVLMHPSERLMIRLPPRWRNFPIQPNISMSISVVKVADKVDIPQLSVCITIHVHRTLSMSELRKPHFITLRHTYNTTYRFPPMLSYVITAP